MRLEIKFSFQPEEMGIIRDRKRECGRVLWGLVSVIDVEEQREITMAEVTRWRENYDNERKKGNEQMRKKESR